MENNIFREMKKEKIKLINEHTEYEKYNYLLKQTIQQLIQSNEKLLLGLKFRFEKLIRLINQDYVMNTTISDTIQQVSKKEIKISEISEIEKKSIEKSIDQTEKELNQIKADLKVAQSSDYNIFTEISDLQKKKEKLIKEQQELKNSIKSLKKLNESNPSLSPFKKQFEQVHENVESLMMLRNQIFKFHKDLVDKQRESFQKKYNGRFYLEPSKLLEVLSISQTPVAYLSSADNFDFSGKTIVDIDSNIASSIKPPNSSKINENQNNDQIKTNFKNREELMKNDINSKNNNNNNQNDIDLVSPGSGFKNDFTDKVSPKTKRKVIKYQPNSDKEKSKKNIAHNSKSKLNNDKNDSNYDSELQSISFPDQPSDQSEEDNQIKKNQPKSENKPFLNSLSKKSTENSTPRKEISNSSSKSTIITTTTYSSLSNQNSLPKLNIDMNSKNGSEKHILISPMSTERKHDNSSNVLLSPISISSKDKIPANKNSLINIFNNNNNNGKNVKSSQNSPRVAGICKPSILQLNSIISQTAPLTPHGSKKSNITFVINDKEKDQNQAKNKDENQNKAKEGNQNREKDENQDKENDENQDNEKEENNNHLQKLVSQNIEKLLVDDKNDETDIKDRNTEKDGNQDNEKEENNNQLQKLISQNAEKLLVNDKNDELDNKDRSSEKDSINKIELNNKNDDNDDTTHAFYTDRKSQTKESFINESKLRLYGLQSINKQLSVSNLELKVTDLQQEALDLEEECVHLNQTLMDARPGSRSFRKKKRPILLRELNLNPISIIEKEVGPFNIRNASTQSEEAAPDIDSIKNQILQNSLNQSHLMMNQHKQELIKLLSTYKIELKVERMNNSRKQIELNEELKRLKLVDPLMYYKELNLEPEEHVDEELAMKRETVYTKEKLENRIVDMKHENENLSYRINDLTFVTNQLQKKLTLMSKEPKYNVRHLCDNLKSDRSVINEILRQTAFVDIETKHIENNIIKFNENYGQNVVNQLTETTDKMKKQLDSMKVRFNNLRAVKEKRSIVLSSENEMKSLRYQQQDILNLIDVTKMRISGTISKIGKQLRSISDFNIRVPTPPPSLNIQEE